MVAVTGMHRSGTSCIAGLLERCGYKLGRQGFIGQISGFDGQPKFDNEKGHFENVDVVVINSLILREAGGEWDNLPPQNKIMEAGVKFAGYMKKFNDLFDGDLFKDPRTSLTIALWQKACPRISKVVLSLRNPLSVARSLAARDQMPIEKALILWCEYNLRCLQSVSNTHLVVVDYDSFKDDMESELHNLLRALDRPMNRNEMQRRIAGFYENRLNHNPFGQETAGNQVPEKIMELYQVIKKLAKGPLGKN